VYRTAAYDILGTSTPESHRDKKRVELPEGYRLEAAGDNLLLKRPNGYFIAAFGGG
jgi:hypothetical protein